MPCQPLDKTKITTPTIPGITGFAHQPLAINIPFPALPFEDLLEVFNALDVILPPGILKPSLSATFSKNILDGVVSLLSQFAPFLMLYKFFTPVLNLILCLIEVVCSIPNPFKIASAITKLFRVCLPEFLALFPLFALPIMILSILLLILLLLTYILDRLLTIILLIKQNIDILSKAVQRLDNDSIFAITKKIGDLLCLFQNLFAVLGVVAILFQIINALRLANFSLPPCSDSSSDGCCTPDVCPAFIKNNKEIVGSAGFLQYFSRVGVDSGLSLPPGFPPIYNSLRNESWQLYDPALTGLMQFNNITDPQDLEKQKIFFPLTKFYSKDTPPDQAPYTVDIRVFYDPVVFGRVDLLGPRYLRIKNCIMVAPPTDGVKDYKNNLIAPYNGTVSLEGGLVFEDDGTTVMKVLPSDGYQATLNTLIHLPDNISASPTLVNDGILFSDVEYSFKINHYVLIGESLITSGCIPEVSQNKNLINSTIFSNVDFNAIKNIPLPDIDAANQCVLNAINNFRENISLETADKLQTDITDCLGKLQQDTEQAALDIILNAYNPYKSNFELDPSIQFTSLPIQVSVVLADNNGATLINKLPSSIASQLAEKLKADITLGEISNFAYDGYGAFIANITSSEPGNGNIKVSFNNNYISIFNNPSNINELPSVSIKELLYTFVLTSVPDAAVRRDEGDVALDAGS